VKFLAIKFVLLVIMSRWCIRTVAKHACRVAMQNVDKKQRKYLTSADG